MADQTDSFPKPGEKRGAADKADLTKSAKQRCFDLKKQVPKSSADSGDAQVPASNVNNHSARSPSDSEESADDYGRDMTVHAMFRTSFQLQHVKGASTSLVENSSSSNSCNDKNIVDQLFQDFVAVKMSEGEETWKNQQKKDESSGDEKEVEKDPLLSSMEEINRLLDAEISSIKSRSVGSNLLNDALDVPHVNQVKNKKQTTRNVSDGAYTQTQSVPKPSLPPNTDEDKHGSGNNNDSSVETSSNTVVNISLSTSKPSLKLQHKAEPGEKLTGKTKQNAHEKPFHVSEGMTKTCTPETSHSSEGREKVTGKAKTNAVEKSSRINEGKEKATGKTISSAFEKNLHVSDGGEKVMDKAKPSAVEKPVTSESKEKDMEKTKPSTVEKTPNISEVFEDLGKPVACTQGLHLQTKKPLIGVKKLGLSIGKESLARITGNWKNGKFLEDGEVASTDSDVDKKSRVDDEESEDSENEVTETGSLSDSNDEKTGERGSKSKKKKKHKHRHKKKKKHRSSYREREGKDGKVDEAAHSTEKSKLPKEKDEGKKESKFKDRKKHSSRSSYRRRSRSSSKSSQKAKKAECDSASESCSPNDANNDGRKEKKSAEPFDPWDARNYRDEAMMRSPPRWQSKFRTGDMSRRNRSRDRSRERARDRSKDRVREKSRDRSKERSPRKSKEKSRHKSKEKSHDKSKEKSRKSRDHDKKRRRSSDGEKDKGDDREKDKDGDLRIRIDKNKLRKIAITRALANMEKGQGPAVDLTLIKSGGKSVAELTEFCKRISEKDKLHRKYVSSDSDSSEEGGASETEEAPLHHPFKVRDPTTLPNIVMNIRGSNAKGSRKRKHSSSSSDTLLSPPPSPPAQTLYESWHSMISMVFHEALKESSITPASIGLGQSQPIAQFGIPKPLPQKGLPRSLTRSEITRAVSRAVARIKASKIAANLTFNASQGNDLQHNVSQPGVSVSQSDCPQSGVSKPDVLQPNSSQDNISKKGVSQTDDIQQDISQSNCSQSEVSKPDDSQPDGSQSKVSNLDVLQSDYSQKDVPKLDGDPRADVSHPDVSQDKNSKPGVSNPAGSQDGISNLDGSHPVPGHDVSHPEVAHLADGSKPKKHDVTQPISQPVASLQDVSKAQTSKADISQNEPSHPAQVSQTVSSSGVSHQEISEPADLQPALSKLYDDVSEDEVLPAEDSQCEVSQLGVSQSDVSKSEVSQPGELQPEDSQLDNAKQLPVLTPQEKQTQAAELRTQFPVSSGTQHRLKESEWVPVTPTTTPTTATKPKTATAANVPAPAATPAAIAVAAAPNQTAPVPGVSGSGGGGGDGGSGGAGVGVPSQPPPAAGPAMSIGAPPPPPPPPPPADSVFPAPVPEINISSIISERIQAMRRLEKNPFDIAALSSVHRMNEQANAWAQSKQLPGQFTGSTDIRILSQEELAGPDKRNQAWAKKDQFRNAPPVQGGIGMFLLQKMGWKPGDGLGKDNEGGKLPLMLDIKMDRKGLSASQENRPQTQGHPGPPAPGAPRAKDLSGKHPVSALTELCTKRRWGAPVFELINETGPAHKKMFLFKVTVNGVEYLPAASCGNKKLAKAQAAAACLQEMGLIPRDYVVQV